MSDFLASADLLPLSGADRRALRACERLFSLQQSLLSLLSSSPERGAPYSGRCLSTPGAPGGRDAPVKHPSVASPGPSSLPCSPGAGHRPAWACTCRCRGRDERGQRCCRRGASGRARCPGREITPGDSPCKPRGTLPWLRSRFNSRRLQTRGRGPGSGPGGNGGRSPGRWPGQRRAFPGMTPLRGL